MIHRLLNIFKPSKPVNATPLSASTITDKKGNKLPTLYAQCSKNKLGDVKYIENAYFERSSIFSGRKWSVVTTKHPKLSFISRFFKRFIGARYITGNSLKRYVLASTWDSSFGLLRKTPDNKKYAKYSLKHECDYSIGTYKEKLNSIKESLSAKDDFSIENHRGQLTNWL